MNIQNYKIDELVPYDKNPRINDAAVDLVANSIREFGFKQPIVIDQNHVIIAGHTRWKAARLLGLREVPCVMADDLTPIQVKAYRLADNKVAEASDWDFDLLNLELSELDIDMSAFGFDMEDSDAAEVVEAVEDNYDPVVPEEPTAKVGQVYQLGQHRLMCGSSTDPADMEKLLDGAVMDLCVTDPPYNVNYGANTDARMKYGKSGKPGRRILNDNMSEGAFYDFLLDFYRNMINALKEGGAYYIFYSDTEGLNFRKALIEAGGQVKQTLIWVKNTFVLGRQDYQWQHEPVLYGWKPGAGHYFTDERTHTTVMEDKIDPKKMTKAELVAWAQSVLSCSLETTVLRENKPVVSDLHPTMKPVKLVGRLVANSSPRGGLVLDSFGGSGSTLIACEQLGRICYMMELEPRYVDVIIDRWEKLTGKKAVLLDE